MAEAAHGQITIAWGESPTPSRRLRAGPLDDLVGKLAGQLGQMVEPGCEVAAPGGRRPELDDQGAYLRLRDQRLDHVPAVPARPRIDAEKLAAPLRDDTVDPRRRLVR